MKYKTSIVLAYFKECGIPEPQVEYRFHKERKWRFDFAWPDAWQGKWGGENHDLLPLALEVQGGIFSRGAHSRGGYIRKEHEKRNAAAVLHWRILYVEPRDLCTLITALLIKRCLGIVAPQ